MKHLWLITELMKRSSVGITKQQLHSTTHHQTTPHTPKAVVPKSIIQSAEEFEVFALHIVFIHTPRAGHPHFTQRTQSKGLTFKAWGPTFKTPNDFKKAPKSVCLFFFRWILEAETLNYDTLPTKGKKLNDSIWKERFPVHKTETPLPWWNSTRPTNLVTKERLIRRETTQSCVAAIENLLSAEKDE